MCGQKLVVVVVVVAVVVVVVKRGVESKQTESKSVGREQRNKYGSRTDTSTKPEQTQERCRAVRHAGKPVEVHDNVMGTLTWRRPVADISPKTQAKGKVAARRKARRVG